MKKVFISIIAFTLLAFAAGFYARNFADLLWKNKEATQTKPKPLERYSIENLSMAEIKPGKLSIGKVLNENDKFISYLFEYSFYPALDDTPKKTTGLLNIPNSPNQPNIPLVLMIRGYVDQTIYQTGVGSKRAGEYFAENGLATIAPDFLGYAGSDSEAGNIFESRFQTYITVVSLINTLQQAKNDPQIISGDKTVKNLFTDHSTLCIWAHSNGGQIALTALEVTGQAIPTTLWAPVSKPFPYSVLYYTDESDDGGKLIRHELAKFEDDYDTGKFSPTNYFDKINKDTKIQIHQGTADDAVPKAWSDALSKKLLDLNLDLDYFVYPGADHNLQPSWDTVVARDLEFFSANNI
jgi:dienelactone hydrolase